MAHHKESSGRGIVAPVDRFDSILGGTSQRDREDRETERQAVNWQ